MDTVKAIYTNLKNQVIELVQYNKTATITVAVVSFLIGAFFF